MLLIILSGQLLRNLVLKRSTVRNDFSTAGVRLAHSADVYNLYGAKRLVTITNVLSASRPSVNQDGENKPFLHIDCFT